MHRPHEVWTGLAELSHWTYMVASFFGCWWPTVTDRGSSGHGLVLSNNLVIYSNLKLISQLLILSITLRTRFSTNCPQLATKCIELVGGRKVVGGHQLSTNVALSGLLWTKHGFKGCLTDGWRPVLTDELGGVLYLCIGYQQWLLAMMVFTESLLQVGITLICHYDGILPELKNIVPRKCPWTRTFRGALRGAHGKVTSACALDTTL
jgi:hypothetical protein